ncbi:MAG: MarR family winged helix-turn-helix transcriptional regulator [Burkholderiales bacterium]|nr:MarR family winged helix-turn-helix transcriptional regulator [Burkholderiales bacterium]
MRAGAKKKLLVKKGLDKNEKEPIRSGPLNANALRKIEIAVKAQEGYTIWDRPGYLVRRLHQIHVAMFLDKVADGSMTPIQYGLLSILATRPNIDQFTIGEELGLDRANVAGILKRLESRKLISRIVDDENRRRKLCIATTKGIALVKQHEKAMKDCQTQLLNPLSGGERDVFMRLLSRLVEGNNESSRTSLRPNGEAFLPSKPNVPSKRSRKSNSSKSKP